MSNIINVIKVGGAVVEDPQLCHSLLKSFASMPGERILVHGGGRTATAMAAKLGIETKMAEGRRITDEAMLEVVTMVYGGLVNKRVVSLLQSLDVNAIGLTGADLECIRAHKRPVKTIDYGFVGDVDGINPLAFKTLLGLGAVPVVAPLSFDKDNGLLNTNADTIATEVAKGMAKSDSMTKVILTFCFEKKGVLADPDDEDSVISVIDREIYASLKADGIVSGGMIPKLDNAFAALDAGVAEVMITNAAELGKGTGTVIRL